MIRQLVLRVSLAVASSLAFTSLALGDDSPQVSAVRAFQRVASGNDWATLYADHCHPHIQMQVTADGFVKVMDSDKGKAIVALFEDVLAAVDSKADAATLISQPTPDRENEYEFILVKVRQKPTRKGQQWHLELKLDQGSWKLMDTD